MTNSEKEQILLRESLRYGGIFLNIDRKNLDMSTEATPAAATFAILLKDRGFCLSEEALRALSLVGEETLQNITDTFNAVMGTKLNWMPMIKGWKVPTGTTWLDHIITGIANVTGYELKYDCVLPCGHKIPKGTFPMERYNGCPFCGKMFRTGGFIYYGKSTKNKELPLFTEEDMKGIFLSLLGSSVPLEGTERYSCAQLLKVFDVPEDFEIPVKENLMNAISNLDGERKIAFGAKYFKTPADILRFLWFEKTGFVRIISPKEIIRMEGLLNRNMRYLSDESRSAMRKKKNSLKLKYSRDTCRAVATWLNNVALTPMQACENMNPKREIWVHMIHSLRLGEYSRKAGFGKLAEILDHFYKQDYPVWQGRLDKAMAEEDSGTALSLLAQRPGVFARSLYSTMLRLNPDAVLEEFVRISDKLPARLLFSLRNSAPYYFFPMKKRIVPTATGKRHVLPPNQYIISMVGEERTRLTDSIKEMFTKAMTKRYAALPSDVKAVFIDTALDSIPVKVGDRADSVQELSSVPQGTVFPVEGDDIRLFIHWGQGLPAQHLDMDLSCILVYADGRREECAYYNLYTLGATHSGDVQWIPNTVGAAEYIEINILPLELQEIQYVIFTCNSYTNGSLSPEMVFGWMDSAEDMSVSDETGVAYDPSCVQQLINVGSTAAKGLVCGVLDVYAKEIIWLEMPFNGQTVETCNAEAVIALADHLKDKFTLGDLLRLKASAQGAKVVDKPEDADEVYTREWAQNPENIESLMDV